MGATSATLGHCRPISSASFGVSDITLSLPKLIPPLAAAPAWTISVFAPMLAMVFCKAAFEPSPISIIAITAPGRALVRRAFPYWLSAQAQAGKLLGADGQAALKLLGSKNLGSKNLG